MAISSFDTVVNQRVEKRIEDAIQALAMNLVEGGARGSDFAATAQEYFRVIGHIYGLREALKICQDVEAELIGKGSGKK